MSGKFSPGGHADKFDTLRKQMESYTKGSTNPEIVRRILQGLGARYLDKFASSTPTSVNKSGETINHYSFWKRHRHHAIAHKLATRTGATFDDEGKVWTTALAVLFGSAQHPSPLMTRSHGFSQHGWLIRKFNELFEIRFGKSPSLVSYPNMHRSSEAAFTDPDTLREAYLNIINKHWSHSQYRIGSAPTS